MANDPTAAWTRSQLAALVTAARENPTHSLDGLVAGMNQPRYTEGQVRERERVAGARAVSKAMGLSQAPAGVAAAMNELPANASPEDRLKVLNAAFHGNNRNPWGR